MFLKIRKEVKNYKKFISDEGLSKLSMDKVDDLQTMKGNDEKSWDQLKDGKSFGCEWHKTWKWWTPEKFVNADSTPENSIVVYGTTVCFCLLCHIVVVFFFYSSYLSQVDSRCILVSGVLVSLNLSCAIFRMKAGGSESLCFHGALN